MSRRIICLVLAASVLAGMVGAAAASRPRPDASPHLFLAPNGPELRSVDVRTVARYDKFSLVEASGDDAEKLVRAGADRRDDMRTLTLGDSELDPLRDRPPAGLKRRRNGAALVVVQFVGPVKPAWLERLRGPGARVVSYVAQNGYLMRATARALPRLAALQGSDPAVRAVVPFRAGDKLASGLRPEGAQRVAVQSLSGEAGARARSQAAGQGRALRPPSAVGPFRTQYLTLDARERAELAADPGVVSIHPAPAPALADERQAQILGANLSGPDPLVPAAPGYLAFHDGLGLGTPTFPFAVDVTDEGIDGGLPATVHRDLRVEGALAGPTRVDYASDWTGDGSARDCGGHGTINAGIVGGFNDSAGATFEDAQGFNYGLGVAPRVRLGGSKIFRCDDGVFELDGTFTDLTRNAYAQGARISSNSWGTDVFGAYDADSQEYDRLVRDADPGTPGNQEMVEVFAAGNAGLDEPGGAGTIGSPATAKNVIAVGASEGVRASGTDGCATTNADADDARDLLDFSSRGPTEDGRVKPDLVAPGSHITGPSPQHRDYNGSGVCNQAFPTGNTLYSLSSGTSHATPAVAGMAALVREWFRQGEGGGTEVPSPALTKALLANTATDLAGGSDGLGGTLAPIPDPEQGWGLGNLLEALDGTDRYFRDQVDTFGASGQSVTRTFTVQDAAEPVRVTLAFTDTFGPTFGDSFVNDLDLSVETGSDSFRGNVLAGGVSVPGGSADPRNNLESVFLPAGTSGTFTVEVTATNVAGDGVPGNGDATDQDFALVVSNASEVAAPFLSPRQATVTPGGDGDSGLEPGEDFAVEAALRNTGSAPATDIAGTLSGPPSVTIDDATTTWPDLAAGATATNSPGDPLTAQLAPDAPCGAPVSLDLEVTSAESATASAVIPVATGHVGTPVQHDSGDVPVAIPDNATVESTLEVAAPGFVKDVNVRIGSLTHTWVGDLTLELEGPDGTTVTLADRPGGVNNSGNNLTGTVFDDQAATTIGSAGTAPPYTGSFRPQGDALSRFDGRSQQGTWTLRVTDNFEEDPGTLNAWGLDLRPATCGEPPAAVQNLSADGQLGAVALDWDDEPAATAYEVFRRGPGAAGYPADPTATPSTSEFVDGGRTGGQEYCYRVRAIGDGGDGPFSEEACAVAQGSPPAGVSGLQATGRAEAVALDWPDAAGADGYWVFRRQPDGSYPFFPLATVAPSEYLDAGRSAGVQECYRVQSRNAFGGGPLSEEACATPPAEPERPVLPKLDLSRVPRRVTVGPRRFFRLSLSGTPGEEGVARVMRRGRRLAGRPFIAGQNGRATVRLRLRPRQMARLRRARRMRARLRVSLGELSAGRRLTLRAPGRG